MSTLELTERSVFNMPVSKQYEALLDNIFTYNDTGNSPEYVLLWIKNCFLDHRFEKLPPAEQLTQIRLSLERMHIYERSQSAGDEGYKCHKYIDIVLKSLHWLTFVPKEVLNIIPKTDDLVITASLRGDSDDPKTISCTTGKVDIASLTTYVDICEKYLPAQ